MIKINIINNIHAEVTHGLSIVRKLLSYKQEYWIKTKYKKERREYDKSFLSKENKVYIGFIPRIENYCKKKGIPLYIEENSQLPIKYSTDSIPEELRDYQLNAVLVAVKNQRGCINAATRTGKGHMAVGIVSCFNNPNVLFLAPGIDIVNEMAERFEKFGYKVSKIGSGKREINTNIVVATVQTFQKIASEYTDYFDIIIADEIHKHIKPDSGLEKILSVVNAPIRIGLTATIPSDIPSQMVIEGLIGPIIVDLSAKRGIEELEILAKPKMKLFIAPMPKGINDSVTFKMSYTIGIVDNQARNSIIAEYVKEKNSENKSVLIFCDILDHIKNISNRLNDYGIEHKIAQGNVSGEDREKIKKEIDEKRILCVISSTVFIEGISISSLDCVINASGMKSETRIIQKLGRGLAKTETKDEVEFVDFLDDAKFLASHTVKRLQIYNNMGWL